MPKVLLALLATFVFAGGAAADRALVVNTGDGSLSVVDLTSMKELGRHPVGDSPYGVAVTKDGKHVAVGVEGESVIKFFDTDRFQQQAAIPIGPMHEDHMALSPDGSQLLVASFDQNQVIVIDPMAMKIVGRISKLPGPHGVRFGPKQQNAYVTCKSTHGIGVVDPKSLKRVKFDALRMSPRDLAFSPDESKVYFASYWVDGIFQMDVASGKIDRLIVLPVPKGSQPLETTYHGLTAVGHHHLLATNEGRNYLDTFNRVTGNLRNRFEGVNKPCCVASVPGGHDGNEWALVSNLGDDTVQLIEVAPNGRMKSLGKAKVGKAPKHAVVLP